MGLSDSLTSGFWRLFSHGLALPSIVCRYILNSVFMVLFSLVLMVLLSSSHGLEPLLCVLIVFLHVFVLILLSFIVCTWSDCNLIVFMNLLYVYIIMELHSL